MQKKRPTSVSAFLVGTPFTPTSMLVGKRHGRPLRNFRAFFLQHPLHSCWAVNIEVGVQGGSVLCVGVLVGRAFFLHDPVPKIDLVLWFGCFEGVNLGGPCNTQIVPPFAGSCAWFVSCRLYKASSIQGAAVIRPAEKDMSTPCCPRTLLPMGEHEV